MKPKELCGICGDHAYANRHIPGQGKTHEYVPSMLMASLMEDKSILCDRCGKCSPTVIPLNDKCICRECLEKEYRWLNRVLEVARETAFDDIAYASKWKLRKTIKDFELGT